jgi:hypothetical protein
MSDGASVVDKSDDDEPLPADGGTFARLVREQTARTQRLAHWKNPPPLGPYHAHLEVCGRCATRPFDLCPVGARALREEVG